MPTIVATPRTSRSFEKAGAKFIQDIVVILAQHAAGRFIDRHNVTLLIEKENPLLEIVEKLPQSWQTDHDYRPLKMFTMNNMLTFPLNIVNLRRNHIHLQFIDFKTTAFLARLMLLIVRSPVKAKMPFTGENILTGWREI